MSLTLKLFQVELSSIDLDEHARDKLLRLVGDRYDPKTGILTLQLDRWIAASFISSILYSQ